MTFREPSREKKQADNFEHVLENSRHQGCRIAFVNQISFNEPMGIGYISAYLKAHFPDLAIEFFHVDANTVDHLRQFKPNFVLYSLMTGIHIREFERVRHIKRSIGPHISVLGGPHITYFPQSVTQEGVDIACQGEGELPMKSLFSAVRDGMDIRKINGLWIKDGDELHQNPVEYLVPELDELPFPDRDLYYGKSDFLRKYGRKPVVGARGCPFKCSYCYNSGLNKIFKSKGKVLRNRSPESVVAEVMQLKERYATPFVAFIEDVFSGVRLSWLQEFQERYASVQVPFYISIRAEFVTSEIARTLKKSGCVSASMAVEHGDYEYRKEYLFRKMTDEKLIEGTRILESEGIRVASPIILGMPFSGIEGDLKTLKLVARSRPTHATTAIFQPYPGTALTELCREKGLIDATNMDHLPDNFFSSPNVKGVEYPQVIKLHNSFSVILLLHRWFHWDVETLFHRLPNSVFIRLLNVFLKYITFKQIIGYKRGWWEVWSEIYQGIVTGVFDVGISLKRKSPKLIDHPVRPVSK
ncbi:MAG: B12-binding domain-containing radical SAM protein [Nitrospirae bacterium]|nr:B12-binding domain-containing radical SAM protein [Magnetococcales bacterium]